MPWIFRRPFATVVPMQPLAFIDGAKQGDDERPADAGLYGASAGLASLGHDFGAFYLFYV